MKRGAFTKPFHCGGGRLIFDDFSILGYTCRIYAVQHLEPKYDSSTRLFTLGGQIKEPLCTLRRVVVLYTTLRELSTQLTDYFVTASETDFLLVRPFKSDNFTQSLQSHTQTGGERRPGPRTALSNRRKTDLTLHCLDYSVCIQSKRKSFRYDLR